MPSAPRQSLAGRLLLTYAVAVVVLVGLLGVVVERSAREALLEEVEYGLEEQAALVAESLEDSEPVAVVDSLAPVVDARVTVVAEDGEVLADSHADPAQMENHGSRPEIAVAYEGGTGTDRRVSESTGFAQLYVAIPGPNGDVVRLSLPENVVSAPIARFRDTLVAWVLVAMVVGVLVVWAVARVLSRPLVRLSEATSVVAGGSSGVEVPRSAVRELDELGVSIQRMEEELESRYEATEAERRTLGVVLDALPQGTLLLETDDRVVYANPSYVALLGDGPATLEQVVPFRIQEAVRTARTTGGVEELDVQLGRPPRTLRVVVSPFHDGRALVVVTDVTERRRIDDVRRDFVANASHELKTPVASMLASAETLQLAMERAPERAPEFAGQIEAAARSMSRLISDLLDLSRLEAQSPAFENIDLGRVVRAVVAEIGDTARERGVEIEISTEPVRVEGSVSDLELAVRNLLDNALRYSDPGGKVTVTLAREGGEAVTTVADTGMGIPQRDLGRVFERFYRIDEARSRATGGTGLGLSIVRHVVETHGGTVGVESELGEGSTFTVRLPEAAVFG